MLSKGPAKRLVVHVGEDQRKDGVPVWQLVLEACQRHQLAGATATRGVMGFGASGHLHHEMIAEDAAGMPVTIEAIDSQWKIDRVLPDLDVLVDDGVIAVQDIEVLKARKPKEAPAAIHHHKLVGKAQMLRVHIGANDTWDGEPLHLALLKRFHQLDLAGATVYRGLEGYGASGRIHRQKTFRSGDEPVTVVAVDFAQKLARAMPYLDEMIGSGLVVISDVDVIFYRATEEAST